MKSHQKVKYAETPKGWANISLGEVLTLIRNGLTLDQCNDSEGYPVTRIETISQEKINPSKVGFLPKNENTEKYLHDYLLKRGDILLSHINSIDHIGKTAIYYGHPPQLLHGMNLLLLRSNTSKVYPFFLLYTLRFLKAKYVFRRIAQKAINQASFGLKELSRVNILLPPLGEQQKIAEILTTVDEEIELTEKIIQETKIVKQGLMQKTFEQHGTNAEIVYLGDHTLIKARIGWRGLSASEYTPDGPYLVAGQHISGSRILWDKCDHISAFRYEESSEIQLAFGDVIISKDGTIGRVGYVDFLPGKATINGTMMLVRSNNQRALHPKYLYYYFQGPIFQKLIKEKVSGSSVPHLFQRDMAKLRIPLVSHEKQSEIIDALTSLDNRLEGEKVRKTRLENLKKGLMHDLLSGKVRVN